MAFLRKLAVVALCLASASNATFCLKPTVRKEWRALKLSEQKEYARAVKCLASLPHSQKIVPTIMDLKSPVLNKNGTLWDDVVYVHIDLDRDIHSTGLFFAWHRFYLAEVENLLERKCGFKGTIPYWNWSLDAADVQNSTMFKTLLGGWGDATQDDVVYDGAFANFPLAYPVPHKLRRKYTPRPAAGGADYSIAFAPANIRNITRGSIGNFPSFQALAEKGPHASGHRISGGDLLGNCPQNATLTFPACVSGPKWSPNDPLFFLHHAMVDKMWADWQAAHPLNFWHYKGGSVANSTGTLNGQGAPIMYTTPLLSDGFFPTKTVVDVINTRGGYLCYKYE